MGKPRRTQRVVILLGALLVTLALTPARGANTFIRGDSNVSGVVDSSDAVHTLSHLFLGGLPSSCRDAADSNDDGSVDIGDPVHTLIYLFRGTLQIPPPGIVCGRDPTADALGCISFSECEQGPIDDLAKIGHVLSRLAYGPTMTDVEHILDVGVDTYIEEQLNPQVIDETDNDELNSRMSALITERQPSTDTRIISPNEIWRFRKGTTAPPTSWNTQGFDDSSWTPGATSIGYGDDDDVTVLDDMRNNYVTVYLRKEFEVADPAAIDRLFLSVDYDDGFVAYLNGTQGVRENVGSTAYNATASGGHEAGTPVDFDLTSRIGLLDPGTNVLAIQAHNTSLGSSDLTIRPVLIDRTILPGPPIREYAGIEEVKASQHVRGIYSRRQLQVVLGDFWENHFTTDFDKVAEHFNELTNSDANDAMSGEQARREAANLEAREYEFFLENALGNFGDLLRYSATSATMLIYLDNILNFKGNANENYTREILELHSYGVDNGYVQKDIEEAAGTFTGWGVCKVLPEDLGDAHSDCGVKFEDDVLVDLGAGWKYLKGNAEPTPGPLGVPTLDWAAIDFVDSAWLNGSTGIGYGDGDDATVLGDMRNNYLSVYLRREIQIPDPLALKNLIMEIAYDDGFVAYLNGIEVARSESLEDAGSPPPFDEDNVDGHEVDDEPPEVFNLNGFIGILKPGKNVLAIHMLNTNLTSSDLSCLPIVVDREILPGSIENGDPNGAWSVHFYPDRHDYGSKTIFAGKSYQLGIPTKPEGNPDAGYADANDLIDLLAESDLTAEFICMKLIRKFVSDEPFSATFHQIPFDELTPYQKSLAELLADCKATWRSTTPKGNIEAIMRNILTSNAFFDSGSYRSKVKDPLEFINSTVRALDASVDALNFEGYMEDMGMHVFDRDEPDGWPETGVDWITTSGMLTRIKFVQDLNASTDPDFMWRTRSFLAENQMETAGEIIDFFNNLLYQGSLDAEARARLVEFYETNDSYNPLPFLPTRGDYESRVDSGVSLMLSLPQWNFQ